MAAAPRGNFGGGGGGGARLATPQARPQSAGAHTAPAGGLGSSGSNTHTTQGGTTIQTGHTSGSRTGPNGGTAAGGAAGMKVTTPNGQTYTTGRYGAAGQGANGGTAATAGRGAVASGPNGTAAAGSRAGVAVGPNGGVAANRAGGAAAMNSSGNWAAAGYRGGVAAGSAGVVAHGTGYMGASQLPAYGASVRGYRYSCYNSAWYTAHPAAWTVAGLTAAALWATPNYASTASYCGCSSEPVTYDYGSNVVISDDSVIVDGETVATAPEYATQATAIADTGRTTQPDAQAEWKALGVFGLMQGEEQVAQRIFQLAVDKNGIIRGNYYDAVGDTTQPVYGSVDKKTQRAAWSIGEKKDIVFETGLNNLTKDEASCLVHYGKDRTEQMTLVRLPEPEKK